MIFLLVFTTQATSFLLNKNDGAYNNGCSYSTSLYVGIIRDLKRRDEQRRQSIPKQLQLTITQIARNRQVSRQLVHKIQKRIKETGGFKLLERGRKTGSGKKSNFYILQYISTLIQINLLWQLKEIQRLISDAFGFIISVSYIHTILTKKLAYRRRRISHIAKKRASSRIERWRRAFCNFARTLDPLKTIFVDEAYFTFHDLLPNYAYQLQGQVISLPIQKVSRRRFSLLAAINAWRVIHWEIVETTNGERVNDEKFARFIEHVLSITPNYTHIILDNASIHHSPNVQQVKTQNPNRLIYTSAYSPDFNAIELFFGRCKAVMKKYYVSPYELPFILEHIINTTPSSVLTAFVRHTFKTYHGYKINEMS